MDLTQQAVSLTASGFPRTRGDGPSLRSFAGTTAEVSPAHAGMDLSMSKSITPSMCFPRTRGDGPPETSGRHYLEWFPPHTRGWTHSYMVDGQLVPVSPAHAGMDLICSSISLLFASFPRTRGDGPPSPSVLRMRGGFPPHTRGWTVRGEFLMGACDVSPAHAGMDLLGRWSRASSLRFPRTRGDGPPGQIITSAVKVFPPHTRGWTGVSIS